MRTNGPIRPTFLKLANQWHRSVPDLEVVVVSMYSEQVQKGSENLSKYAVNVHVNRCYTLILTTLVPHYTCLLKFPFHEFPPQTSTITSCRDTVPLVCGWRLDESSNFG